MTLYLQLVVGGGRYLVPASQIRGVALADDPAGKTGTTIDLRQAFDQPQGAAGARVLIAAGPGAATALLADSVAGLVELADAEFRPLPPIGPAGALFDAISTRIVDNPPALRLRVEHLLAGTASAQS